MQCTFGEVRSQWLNVRLLHSGVGLKPHRGMHKHALEPVMTGTPLRACGSKKRNSTGGWVVAVLRLCKQDFSPPCERFFITSAKFNLSLRKRSFERGDRASRPFHNGLVGIPFVDREYHPPIGTLSPTRPCSSSCCAAPPCPDSSHSLAIGCPESASRGEYQKCVKLVSSTTQSGKSGSE
jgi:hypothetical protein